MRVVIDPKEAAMLHFASRSFGIRLALLTSLVGVVAAIVPFVALAGNGDPTGI